jgi:hypothetical protein
MNPNFGEVWRTKSGNLCLIVEDFITPREQVEFTAAYGKRKPAMMWFDPIDKIISVSEIMERLAERVENVTPAAFLAQMANMMRIETDPVWRPR